MKIFLFEGTLEEFERVRPNMELQFAHSTPVQKEWYPPASVLRINALNEKLRPRNMRMVYSKVDGESKRYGVFYGDKKVRGWATLKDIEHWIGNVETAH